MLSRIRPRYDRLLLNRKFLFSTETSNQPNINHNNNEETPNVRKPRWWSISGQIERLLLRSKLTDDVDTARLAGKTTSIAFFSLLGMTALGTVGVDTAPILTGIGVTGFTLGFAMKEIATNFLSGMMLVVSRPFRKGQTLRVVAPSLQGIEGEVLSIDARYVLLRPKAGGTIMVPSVIVYTNPFYVTQTTSGANPSSNLPSSLPQSTQSSPN